MDRQIPPGWYAFDDEQRYWDGEQWTEHRAPAAKPPSQRRIWLACALVLVVLGTVWAVGTFDGFLSQFGLNAKPCAELLLTGNTLCGDELEAACEQRFFTAANAEVCREVD